jgi:hypothetical protein
MKSSTVIYFVDRLGRGEHDLIMERQPTQSSNHEPKTRKALADQIVDLARKGRIPTPFGVDDFRNFVPGFAESHMITVLANYEENGDMVRRGRTARFVRVGEGLYKPA